MRADIVVADSVTALGVRHRGAVLVSGSHGGVIAAHYAIAAGVRAAIFNDAGIGLDDAGIAGLPLLEALGIAAAAVSHRTARIGDGHDTLASGIVSKVNGVAQACGVHVGSPCSVAAEALREAPVGTGSTPPPIEGRHLLQPGHAARPPVIGIDSIGLAQSGDHGTILVVGSHGGVHGGDAATALPVDAFAAFFHDAGRGKDGAGVSRLPVLAQRGIPAGAVDYRTARIGDARSLWETGVLSCANAGMQARGVRAGMTIQAGVARLVAAGQPT